MKILVIDDKTAQLELAQQAAIEVAEKKGIEIELVTVDTTKGYALEHVERILNEGNIDAVATDLLFNPLHGMPITTASFYDTAVPPAGLLVALIAVSKGIPVGICSDAQEGELAQNMIAAGVGGSHMGAFGYIQDSMKSLEAKPILLNGGKRWQKTFIDLINRIQKAANPSI